MSDILRRTKEANIIDATIDAYAKYDDISKATNMYTAACDKLVSILSKYTNKQLSYSHQKGKPIVIFNTFNVTKNLTIKECIKQIKDTGKLEI